MKKFLNRIPIVALVLLLLATGVVAGGISCCGGVSEKIAVYTDAGCDTSVDFIDWGDLERGATTTHDVYIKNRGNADVSVSASAPGQPGLALTLQGGPVEIAEGTGVLCTLQLAADATAPLGECTFDIEFISEASFAQASSLRGQIFISISLPS